MWQSLVPTFVFLLVELAPHPGRADESPPFEIGPKPAWYLLGGATGGGTVLAHNRGGFLGGEASFVRLGQAGGFLGVYGDGYRDLGGGRTYTTTGLEAGYKFIGIDGGAAARFGGGHPEFGPTGRLFLGVGVVSVYGRYSYFNDGVSTRNEHVVQIGALLKFPWKVWGIE